jgi:diguanylate cyclase (GGDEF)-like protein
MAGSSVVIAEPGERIRLRGLPSSRTLLIGAVLLAGLFVTGIGDVPHSALGGVVYDLVLFNVIPLAAAVVSLQAARRVPAERVVWTALAVMWVLAVAGNLIFSVAPPSGGAFPSLADACYLAAYPSIAVGALGLLHVRGAHLQPSAWLDGVTAALGVTACAAAFLLTPSLDLSGLDRTAATLTYPVADVLLLALLVAVIAVLGLYGDRGLLLITVGLIAKLAGDVLFTWAEAQGGYVVGGPVDLTWITAALAGMTAAHLAGDRPGGRKPQQRNPRTGWRVLVIPLSCTIASLVVLGVEWGDGSPSVGEACALGCVATALMRTAVTFRELLGLQEVRRQAATDDLTGLPNRRSLIDSAEKQVASGRPTALLLLDLDGFKAVNDGLGHRAGDDLLCMLGDRISPALRPDDVLARFGGDEFAVLLPGAGTASALEVAERVHDLVCLPVTVAGVVLQVGASIGVAAAPDHADSVPGLLHCADTAMYVAKSGHGGVRTYSREFDRRSRVDPAGDDRGPAAAAASALHFRPVVDADEQILWADAVVRRPDGTAEDAGVSALGEVLAAVGRWWAVAPVPARVRLSAGDLRAARLPDRVSTALLRHDLPLAALVLHVGQNALLDSGDEVSSLLAALRARGLHTVIEGQGQGPGALALARLRDMPADHVHLDPALTGDVVTDQRCSLVVAHTVALARALGTHVLADSADEHTDAVLTRLGCTVVRSPVPPLPADEFGAWLRRDDAVQPSA